MCVEFYIYAQQQYGALGKQGDGQGVYIYGPPSRAHVKSPIARLLLPQWHQSNREANCFSVYIYIHQHGLVFNWSAAKLCTIMEAIMRPCLCLPILLHCIIMLSVLAYAWSAPQRSLLEEKFICAQRESCYLRCFHRGMQFFMPYGIMSPCNSLHLHVLSVGIWKYSSESSPVLSSGGESFFINQRLRWEIC